MLTIVGYIGFLSVALATSLALYLGLTKIELMQTNSFNSFTHNMVETLLSGIVLGLIPVTISGLFVTAYLQYRRGDQLSL